MAAYPFVETADGRSTAAKQQYTPGPWQLGDPFVSKVDGFHLRGFPISAGGQAIARVWAGAAGKLGFGNEDANARLIVASPDRLFALKRIESLLNRRAAAGDTPSADACRIARQGDRGRAADHHREGTMTPFDQRQAWDAEDARAIRALTINAIADEIAHSRTPAARAHQRRRALAAIVDELICGATSGNPRSEQDLRRRYPGHFEALRDEAVAAATLLCPAGLELAAA